MTAWTITFFAVAIFFALLGLVRGKAARDRRQQIRKRLYGGKGREDSPDTRIRPAAGLPEMSHSRN